MTTPPTWKHDAANQTHTLVVGDMHCQIRLSLESWAAIMNQRDTIVALANFGSLEEAQAWCEDRIAARRAGKYG